MELAQHTELVRQMELARRTETGGPATPRSPRGSQGHGGAWLSAPSSRATCRTGPWVPCVAAGRGSQGGAGWETVGLSFHRGGTGHSVAVLPGWPGERWHHSRHWCSLRSAWLDVPPGSRCFWCFRCSWCAVGLAQPMFLVVLGWTPHCCLPVPPALPASCCQGRCYSWCLRFGPGCSSNCSVPAGSVSPGPSKVLGVVVVGNGCV